MNPYSWLNYYCALVMFVLAVGVYRRRTGWRSNKIFFGLTVTHGLLLIFDGLYWSLYGVVGKAGLSILFILIYAQCLLTLMVYHYYLRAFWKDHYGIEENRKLRYMPIVVFVLENILWISSFYNHIFFEIYPDGTHYYTKYHFLSQLGVLLILLPDTYVILKERHRIGIKNCCFWIGFPVSIVVVRYFDLKYNLPFVYPSMALMILCIFTMVNAEMDSYVSRMSLEITESMGKVMVGQIQPHFIYNVLNSISILCRKDSERAARVTDSFAKYLRWNTNSVLSKEPVSIGEEISHTKIYLDLEKERFGDILSVEWNVEDENFFIPPLVLQPLVENAVRHGICQKEDGGNVWIHVFSTPKSHSVTIEDDGVGFDTSILSNLEPGIKGGLKYAKAQIEGVCNGRLDVDSTPGKGTKISISLPRDTNLKF